jgi:hypothetical protein
MLPPFPSTPADGATFSWAGRLYEYEAAANTWWPVGPAEGIGIVEGDRITVGSPTAPSNPQPGEFWINADGKGYIRQLHPGPPPTPYWWQVF